VPISVDIRGRADIPYMSEYQKISADLGSVRYRQRHLAETREVALARRGLGTGAYRTRYLSLIDVTAASKTIDIPASKPAGVLDESLRAAIRELSDSSPFALQLLNASPVQLLVLDRELTVRWANESFATSRRIAAAAVDGQPASEFFGDLSAHAVHFNRALEGATPHFVLRIPALLDNLVRDVNVYLRSIRNADGRVSGLCMCVGDLGIVRNDDRGLPNTAEGLRQILGSLPNYVFVLDRELKVRFANRAVASLSINELEGVHITKVFPTKLHPVALTTLHRVLATGQFDGFSAELDAPDSRNFDMHVTPVTRDGKIVALTLVATETTEQVRAERAIATQARMIESMLEGVAVVNEQGVVEITNPAFDRMFGYGRGDLIGRDMAELTNGAFTQRGRWPLKASSDSLTLEFETQRRDGTGFAAAGVLSRFEVAGRNHSLVVLQDVSERKQLERAILLAVNREQYRIGNDLHDGLGQELTGIALMLRGVAGRLLTEYPAILPEVEGITRLVSNAIENTRALARGLSPVNLERGGLQDALEGLAMNAIELYGVQVVFSHRLQSAKPLGAELANHLYRIAQEAVRNAVHHGQARTIRLHLTTARGKVSLAITDDGIGLPEQAMDATGMGLKIMRYRARMLGGEVHFERVQPSGTRVVCECPIELGTPTARPKPRVPKAKRAAANAK
jgi:PAS domain S-box-containing protein